MARFSTQRELTLNVVTTCHTHQTVDEIYAKVIQKMPKVSKATVYRNLQQLEEMQEVCSFVGPNQVTYYESYQDPHHHFVCTGCSKIQNIDNPQLKVCMGCLDGKLPFQIDTIFTTIHGLCEKCKA